MKPIANLTARAGSLALLIALVGAPAGCKDDTSCDAVVDHTLSLMPEQFKANADKKQMMAKCEEAPVEARKCLLAAKDVQGLAECAAKHKPTTSAGKPVGDAPAAAPVAKAKPAPQPQKKIEPQDLPEKLAKLYQGTEGLNFGAGQWQKFHEAVIARHGEPSVTKELYGKPAYFWAAQQDNVCVQFGYPQPEDLKAQTWTTWRADIVQPPAPDLDGGERMLAERDWNECVAYAAGKLPN